MPNAPHTLPRADYEAALATLLTRAAGDPRATVDAPDGTLSTRLGTYTRICLRNRAGERVALVVVRAPVDPAAVAPLLAALLDHAPTVIDHRFTQLDAEQVHWATRMRPNNRTVTARSDGTASWTLPGASVHLERHTVTVSTPAAYVRVVLDGSGWTSHGVAAALDAALWQLAPAARHMTRTSAERGWTRLSDFVPGAVGRDRHRGHVHDGLSTARCSCGFEQVCDTRQIARWANARHLAQLAEQPAAA